MLGQIATTDPRTRDRASIAVDRDGRIVFWNERAEDSLGVPAGRAMGRRLGDVLEFENVFGNRACADLCGLREMVARGSSINRFALGVRAAGETSFRRYVVDVEGHDDTSDGRGGMVLFLLSDRRRSLDGDRWAHTVEDRDTRAVELTRRQAQILRHLSAGSSAQEIADLLSISVNTVRKHIQAALRKLGANNQAHAVAEALRRGLF